MGTAVLLPQDCLPTSKSRHKPNLSDVLYGSSSSPRVKGGTFQALDPQSFCADQSRQKFFSTKRSGWCAALGSSPLPEQGQAPVKIHSLQREVDGKKTKARRSVDTRDGKFVSKSGPDTPVFTILQRPKDKDLANELIAKFLAKVDESKPTIGLPDLKSDMKSNECNPGSRVKSDVKINVCKLGNGTQNAFLDAKNGVSNLRKRMVVPLEERPKLLDSKLDVPKLDSVGLSTKIDWPTSRDPKVQGGRYHGTILGSSKPVNVPKRSGCNRFDDLLSVKGLNQMLSLQVTGEHKSLQTVRAAENFGCKLAHANRPARVDNMAEGGVARLRRASTDPQIVNHLVSQHRSEVMEIPHSNARSFHGVSRSSSMSCPERWAGPAYSSSPAPSSLPLPKFSLVSQKMSSTDVSPQLVVGKLTQHPESGSVRALPGAPQPGELDMASATRSLRRMLKLEPL